MTYIQQFMQKYPHLVDLMKQTEHNSKYHEEVSSLDYFVFDVYDINKKQYLTPEARREFCKQNNIQHVPVTNPNATPLQMTLEELLAHVDTESMNPGTVSEGRVYKSNSYPTMSFKVINNKYLLKHEK